MSASTRSSPRLRGSDQERSPSDMIFEHETAAQETREEVSDATAPSRSPQLEPQRALVQVLDRQGSVTVDALQRELKWERVYEDLYGDFREFLSSYKVIFDVSATSGLVTLRRSRRPKTHKNASRGSRDYCSCAYTSVCERFDLTELEGIYKRRGLLTEFILGVLVVRFENFFDMFLFENGAVVWWGPNRADHWIVEDDFTNLNAVSDAAIINRHPISVINTLFPKWVTYKVDPHLEFNPRGDNSDAFVRFRERLSLDFFRIPANSDIFPAAEVESKMAVSFALAAASKVDFFEHITEAATLAIGRLTSAKTSIMEHLLGSRRLSTPWMLEGELRDAQLMMSAITDEPHFVFEKTYLKDFVRITLNQYSVEDRRQWFNDKCDAQYQLIDSITEQRHSIFMMKSDAFLIIILVFDVCVLLLKLTLTLFFHGGSDDMARVRRGE